MSKNARTAKLAHLFVFYCIGITTKKHSTGKLERAVILLLFFLSHSLEFSGIMEKYTVNNLLVSFHFWSFFTTLQCKDT